MNPLLALLSAAALAILLVGVSRPFARRTRAVSRVQPDRWHRSGDIPRLGGPPLLLALSPWLEHAVLGVLAVFCAIGVWDDYRRMSPLTKAAWLIPPCALVGWLLAEPWVAAACWVSTNALNMLDHADGTAGSASAGSLFAAGEISGMTGAGACLGFLAHNWAPARAFLGDGGSLMLGALLVVVWHPHGVVPLLAGLAVPLLDAAFVVARRLARRQPPWQGGTDHTGHVLLRAGLPPKWLPVLYGAAAGSIAALGRLHS